MKQAGRALAVLAAALAWPVGLAAQEAHVTHVAGAKFAPFPNIPECVKGAVLQGDPGTGPSIILIRGMAGCRIPRHWHAATETLMFVSGAARLGMKGQPAETLRAGSYGVVPAKHPHDFACTAACSFFISADGPFDIHYVDDAGNEIPPEQALPKAKAKPAGAAKKGQ
jgi:quercetin dioxygenase-like cupin family protein